MPIRWKSSAAVLGYPLVSVAIGPDPTHNEFRGHARGIIAIGDIATGLIALGGVARGAVALGGLAIGGIVLGGCAIGVLTFAGLAMGYIAIGGLAIGYVAIGGLAIGYYAMGGVAFGKFVIGPLHRDSQAVEFFKRLWAGLPIPPRPEQRLHAQPLRGVHADYSHLSWTFSNKNLNEYLGEWVFGHWLIMRWNDPYSTVLWARVPMLLLTLLLGLAIYVFGSRLGNAWGGLLCPASMRACPRFSHSARS